MSEALILEFNGVGADKYREVNVALGIDPDTGEGSWPDGLLAHTGASSAGGLLVLELWDSKDAQAAFMGSRLGPALGGAGVPEPSRAEWLTVEGHYTP